MMFMNAYEEYKIIRQIRDAEMEMYRQIEIEVLREKNKELKKEINRLKDLLDQHLNIKTKEWTKNNKKIMLLK